MNAGLRAYRRDAGWSQSELAERCGISRQTIGAIESGRHVPSVAAALAIAGALATTVEALFGPRDAPRSALTVSGEPSDGPVRVARVGDHLVAAPIAYGIAEPEQWALADASLHAGRLSLFEDIGLDGLVVAGCDPALGILARMVERTSAQRIVPVVASTGGALEALAAGRVHAVVVHAAVDRDLDPPCPVQRRHLARWQVGVASARASGVPSIDEIASRRLRVVQRDPGAGAQQAFVRALEDAGAPGQLPGPVASGHLDSARRVHDGAVAGLTIEAAARSFDLRFVPLELHTVEVWLATRWVEHPAASRFIEMLHAPGFRRRLELIGGYDLTWCGTERLAG